MTEFNLTNRDMEQITITVTVPRIFRFRIWLGLLLIKVGVRCTGCSLVIEHQ